MKNKLQKFLRIKKEIKKGILRIYYFFEVKILKYCLFTINSFRNNDEQKISLLCPTKNRSSKFKRFSVSLLNKTFNLNRIELLICFDSEEKELDKYKEEFNKLSKSGVSVKIFFKNYKTHALRNNFLAKKSEGKIIFPINDDLILITKNWDNILENEFSRNADSNPLCIWINCDRKYKNLDYSAFPVINNSWYSTLGYIVPEYFRFWYLDWWICEVSRISKNYFLSQVSIHQFHAESYENEKDSVYRQNATEDNLIHDYNMWLKTKNYRIKDSIKIKSKLK